MIDTHTIEQQMKEGNAVVIDVRRDDEWESGHIQGAIHYDLARIEAGEMPNIPTDTTIYTHCRSGSRATRATQILQEHGFHHVVCIGGYDDWKQAGGGVVEVV